MAHRTSREKETVLITILRNASNQIRQSGGTMIRKVKDGYKVVSEKGRNLGGPYKTKDEAKKRLRQVEFFKRHRH